jgi:hypothetical protein
MNLTAANGILIVAITLALGLHWDSPVLIGAAFAMAGSSYLVNLIDELDNFTPLRGPLFGTTVLTGLATYVYVAIKLIGG